ncbi:MAG: hypothetical protein QOE55_6559 [Acidobacteriaceae bacterium]|nr:hypothetical protein [Acidobacteriaceae bacterium]
MLEGHERHLSSRRPYPHNLFIYNRLAWCREGGSNPHGPKPGGF